MKNNVKYLRRSKEFDITQEELAKAIGVSRHTIMAIEKGGTPKAEVMLRISNFFNKDPREIFFTNDVVCILQKDQKTA